MGDDLAWDTGKKLNHEMQTVVVLSVVTHIHTNPPLFWQERNFLTFVVTFAPVNSSLSTSSSTRPNPCHGTETYGSSGHIRLRVRWQLALQCTACVSTHFDV